MIFSRHIARQFKTESYRIMILKPCYSIQQQSQEQELSPYQIQFDDFLVSWFAEYVFLSFSKLYVQVLCRRNHHAINGVIISGSVTRVV